MPVNVLLITPPLSDRRKTPVGEALFYSSMPLGLGYLGAVLEKNRHEVQIIDTPVERLDNSGLLRKARDFNPSFIGISSTTVFFAAACHTAKVLKESFPDVPLALGGAHISAAGAGALDEGPFDVGVIGEGESTIVELIERLENGGTPEGICGTIYKDGNKKIQNPPRKLIKDLDSLPFPARHLMPDPMRYYPIPNDDIALPKMSLITSRGCPFKCAFCDHGVFGKGYRETSAEYAVAEFEELVKHFNAKSIAFLDSVFTLHLDRVRAICAGILSRDIMVPWTCPIRADISDTSIFKDLASAGCWRVRIGIESGNEGVLDSIGKGITLDQIRNTVISASEAGLSVKGFFIIGHLADTEETIKESISFARSIPLDDITVQLNAPFPNTAEWKELTARGREPSHDWERYSLWEPVFVPDGLTPGRLVALMNAFYRSFYLRPATIIRKLAKFSAWRQVFKHPGLLKELLFHGRAAEDY